MRLLLTLVLMLAASPVSAQTEELVGRPPAETPTVDDGALPSDPDREVSLGRDPPPPEPTPVDPAEAAEAAGWKAYRAAIASYDRGQSAEAYQLLRQFLADYPNHPAAPEARERIAVIEAETAAAAAAKRRGNARAEFVLGQAAHGAVDAIYVWSALPDRRGDQVAPLALGALGGALAGGITSGVLTSGGLERAHATAMNNGTAWGGFLTWTAAKTNFGISKTVRFGLTAVGQGLGLGAGHLAYKLLEPTPGQVSMVSSGGLWSTLLTTGAFLSAQNGDWPPRIPVLAGAHFLAASGGLAAGALVAAYHPIPRGRMLYIDLAGFLGALGAPVILGLGSAFGGLFVSPGTAWAVSTSGAALGLGLGVLLTRNHQRQDAVSDVDVRIGLAPNAEGKLQPALVGNF